MYFQFSQFILESYNVVPQGTIYGLKVIHVFGLVAFDSQSEMTESFAFDTSTDYLKLCSSFSQKTLKQKGGEKFVNSFV